MNKEEFIGSSIKFFENYSFEQQQRIKNYKGCFNLGVDINLNLKPMNKRMKSLFLNLVSNLKTNANGIDYDPEKIQLTKIGIFKPCVDALEVNNYLAALDILKNRTTAAKLKPTTIRGFAIRHRTHNKNTKDIRETNHYFQIKRGLNSNPEALVLTPDGDEYVSLDFSEAIIVENQYIFEQSGEEYIHYFEQYGFKYSGQLIIYGSGAKSTSRLLKRWLDSFDNVYCFYDLDMNGYKMFTDVARDMKTKIEFMIPKLGVLKSLQNEIRTAYESDSIEDKNNYKLIKPKSDLFKLITDKFDGKVIVPMYAMYEESFVLF